MQKYCFVKRFANSAEVIVALVFAPQLQFLRSIFELEGITMGRNVRLGINIEISRRHFSASLYCLFHKFIIERNPYHLAVLLRKLQALIRQR